MRLNAVLFLLAIYLPLPALAQMSVSVAKSLRWEQSNDGRNFETRRPFAFRMGYRFASVEVMGEFLAFSEEQRSGVVLIERAHQEWLLWMRRLLIQDAVASPYVGAGIGLQSDRIKTEFLDEVQVGRGEQLVAFSLSGGLNARIWRGLEADVEGRLISSQGFAPNPLFGVAFYVGYRF